jgi:hypothetical protein
MGANAELPCFLAFAAAQTHQPSIGAKAPACAACCPGRATPSLERELQRPPPPGAAVPAHWQAFHPNLGQESTPSGLWPSPAPSPAEHADELTGFEAGPPLAAPGDPIARSEVFPGSYVRTKGVVMNLKSFQGPAGKTESQIVNDFG